MAASKKSYIGNHAIGETPSSLSDSNESQALLRTLLNEFQSFRSEINEIKRHNERQNERHNEINEKLADQNDKVEHLFGYITNQSKQLKSHSKQLETKLNNEVKVKNLFTNASTEPNYIDDSKVRQNNIAPQHHEFAHSQMKQEDLIQFREDQQEHSNLQNPNAKIAQGEEQRKTSQHRNFEEEVEPQQQQNLDMDSKQQHEKVTRHLSLCDSTQNLIVKKQTTTRFEVAERSMHEGNPATQQQEMPTTVKNKGITTLKETLLAKTNIFFEEPHNQYKVPQLLPNDTGKHPQFNNNIHLTNSDPLVKNIELSWNERDKENIIKKLQNNDNNFDENCNPYNGYTVYTNEHDNSLFSKKLMELPLTSHNNMEIKSQQNNSYLMQKIFNLATQLKEPDKSQITTIENFCHGYNLTEPNVTFRLKNNCAASPIGNL